MRGRRRAIGCVVALAALCAGGLTACGGSDPNAVVVRVGDHKISKATVDHWIGVVRRGGAFSGFRIPPPHDTPKRRVLAFLISSDWIIDEAARQGIGISRATVDQALSQREHEGVAFERRLRATGETIADIKLEMKAELAIDAMRTYLASRAGQITPKEIVDYYRANRRRFYTFRHRVVDFLRAESKPAVEALVRRVGSGRRFTKAGSREDVTFAPDDQQRTAEDASLANAIFAARLGVVSSPMLVDEQWVVFVIRKAIPGVAKSLASVRPEVRRQLDVKRQLEIAAEFEREYLQRWVGRTKCASGYVVPGCSESASSPGPYEDPFSKRAHSLLSERGVMG